MELTFPANAGLNTYFPPITGNTLAYASLFGLEPRLGRLVTSKAPSLFQNLTLDAGDNVLRFCSYTLTNLQYSNLYCITKKKIFFFDFSSGAFISTPIYTYETSREEYPQVIPWYDTLYVVCPGHPTIKLEYKTATVISTIPYGRYGIMSSSHVFLGSVGTVTNQFFTRLQWSDLDDPESFDINPAISEADFFDLEAGETEITGISSQRGNIIIYTRETIWQATYVGFPGSFKFQPLFVGLGNSFHYSLVRVKEIDYFIGPDGFYRLNGYQPEQFGQEAWEFFIADVKITVDSQVPGFLDTRNNQIFWIYTNNSSVLSCMVYNYKEDKWCFRPANSITAFFDSPRTVLKGYHVIDDISTLINNDTNLIDDPNDNVPLVVSQLAGTSLSGKAIVQPNAAFVDLAGANTTAYAETFDFYLSSPSKMKEFLRVDVEHKGNGNIGTSLTLQIGRRNNQREAISWSSAIAQKVVDNTMSFFFRAEGTGKHVRFKFSISNNGTDNLTEFWLMSLSDSTPPDETSR